MLWMGFPRDLLLGDARDRREAFSRGDTRGVSSPAGRTTQIEYLEWFTQRDERGRITKVTFTTETPEYWMALFRSPGGPDRVLELYRELLGNPAISLAEITDAAGRYDPLNVWNTSRGVIHYIVERQDGAVNTLRGALNLVALRSTGPIVSDNYPVDQIRREPPQTRASRSTSRALARKGLQITDRRPDRGLHCWLGRYRLEQARRVAGWQLLADRPAGGYSAPLRLRLVYEVPASEGFVVGDIRIGGRPIEFGGQIAEHLTVTFPAVAGILP